MLLTTPSLSVTYNASNNTVFDVFVAMILLARFRRKRFSATSAMREENNNRRIVNKSASYRNFWGRGFNQRLVLEAPVLPNNGVDTRPRTAATATGGSWLNISPSSGVATATAPASLTVTATPGSLAVGTYTGSITGNQRNDGSDGDAPGDAGDQWAALGRMTSKFHTFAEPNYLRPKTQCPESRERSSFP